MLLGLDNSRARGRPQQPLTRVAFFSSYWIDNRTGMDLMFQDHAAAHPNPFLLGARMPGAYAEVLVPGKPAELGYVLCSLCLQGTLSLFQGKQA